MIARGRRRSFQHRVLDWYAAHGRDLPWRRTRDPYAILVSEVLSHQTQIARVLPVYERLLGRYPTVTALASAPLAEVKAITDPLGYKIRGRWLHTAALRVADRPGGTFPDTLDELRSFQDWTVRSGLASVRGVAEVASIGGFVKQYQVALDPARLSAYNVSPKQVVDAIRASNNDAEGRLLEFSGREYMVRARGSLS